MMPCLTSYYITLKTTWSIIYRVSDKPCIAFFLKLKNLSVMVVFFAFETLASYGDVFTNGPFFMHAIQVGQSNWLFVIGHPV